MNFLSKLRLKSLQKKVRKLQHDREQGKNVNIKHEIAALHDLAKFYDQHPFDKDVPHAEVLALEYYRAAAQLDDAEAQYICAQRFFEQAKFWDAWRQDIYGTSVHQSYAKNAYNEALGYLQAAEDSGHVLAKRLHGLAYIRGWGLDKDTNTGFKLVIESIEMANAWDKATQIFEQMGLNSPEFFETLMSYQANHPKS